MTTLQRFRLALAAWIFLTGLGSAVAASDPAGLQEAFAEAARYESGMSLGPFREIEDSLRQSQARPQLRAGLETGLIRLAGPESTFEARRFACKQLGIIGSSDALPVLGSMLESDQTAGIACLALSTYPPGKADALLRRSLAKATGTARVQIINTLGDRRDEKSTRTLAKLALDNDPAIARPALAALGKLGSPTAWKAISAAGEKSRPELSAGLNEASVRCAARLAAAGNRKLALAIYRQLGDPSRPVAIRRSAFQAILALEPEVAEQRILVALHATDPALKPVAIAAVRSIASPGAAKRFAAELPQLSPENQVFLIDSLAARKEPEARTAIEGLLTSKEPETRLAVINALGRIGGPETVPALAKALGPATPAAENRAIVSALSDLPGGAAVDKAIAAELQKSSGQARAHLLTALVARQGPAAKPLLIAEIENPDPAVSKTAFREIEKFADASHASLLVAKAAKLTDNDARSAAEAAAAAALAKVQPPADRTALVLRQLETTTDTSAKASLLALLPVCGDSSGLPMLTQTAASSEPALRDAAVQALAEWPSSAAWPALLEIARQPGTDPARSVAFRGLVRIAGEENGRPGNALVEKYRELLEAARNDADLKQALGALGGVADPGALKLALPLLSNPAVSAEATAAVKRIAEAVKSTHPEAAQEALKQLPAK